MSVNRSLCSMLSSLPNPSSSSISPRWTAPWEQKLKDEAGMLLTHPTLGFWGSLFIVVQSLNHVWFLVTPWTATHQVPLSSTVSWSLLKSMSIELMMLSNHLILCCPLLHLPSVFPSINVFPNESAIRIRWPKCWNFSFSISPSSEYSGLIFFRIDWFDLFAAQGTFRVFSSTTIQKHQLFSNQSSLWVLFQLSSVQSLSHVQLFATPWTAACLAQTCFHWVSDAIQPFHPLSSPSPAFSLSQYQGLFQWINTLHEVAKVLEFQLQSFQWIFRTDFL